jgi:hypothetical protein
VAHEQLTYFCRSEFQTLETMDKEAAAGDPVKSSC